MRKTDLITFTATNDKRVTISKPAVVAIHEMSDEDYTKIFLGHESFLVQHSY
ncbi:hypothetical protein HUK80_06480 [Flavobacterium sp. MAH-1]|uniref:hypothetical protein n=1 Tax=Flavobacterium agri TaxID=2743471 RepID=UPI00158D0315|nr:hypothetical protein [Flavobacterium agri]NUY80535.1 hypothetical protein [Flavobacterium agri]